MKQYFDRGVQLLADNELNPALPESAFKVVRQQTAETVAGLLKSPGYRAERAVKTGVLPKEDPELREPTPRSLETLTLTDVKDYYGKTSDGVSVRQPERHRYPEAEAVHARESEVNASMRRTAAALAGGVALGSAIWLWRKSNAA